MALEAWFDPEMVLAAWFDPEFPDTSAWFDVEFLTIASGTVDQPYTKRLGAIPFARGDGGFCGPGRF